MWKRKTFEWFCYSTDQFCAGEIDSPEGFWSDVARKVLNFNIFDSFLIISQIRMWPMEGRGGQKNSIKQRNGGRHNCWWQGMLRRLPLGYLYTHQDSFLRDHFLELFGKCLLRCLDLPKIESQATLKTSSTRPIRSGPFWARNGRSQSSYIKTIGRIYVHYLKGDVERRWTNWNR